MGKNLADKIKELSLERQGKIAERAQELIIAELLRQETRRRILAIAKLKASKRARKYKVIFRKLNNVTL